MYSSAQSILITAYAVNPYKGSEDGMGWNFILQAAASRRVFAVTRINNGEHIRQYMQEHPEQQTLFDRITWLHFDWPKWMIFWKRGPMLSMVYYYGWQFTLAIWLLLKRLPVDVVHNLNFHNDWTPSFLWVLGKPMVWGPVGHHPRIPAQFLLRQYGVMAYLKDRLLWAMKWWFWHADPFVFLTKKKAIHVLCMNQSAADVLRLSPGSYSIMPSVATQPVVLQPADLASSVFHVISVGRFVPLKGFDITVLAFAKWFNQLPADKRASAKLSLVGAGPYEKQMAALAASLGIGHCTDIIAWMPKSELDSLYRQASVFLFPSHEGAGMVVAEAMSYGLPVICFNNDGPGSFTHPHSRLKVDYDHYDKVVQAFAEKLHHLYSNQPFHRVEAALSLTQFRECFMWQVRGRQLQAVYDRLPSQTTSVHLQSMPVS